MFRWDGDHSSLPKITAHSSVGFNIKTLYCWASESRGWQPQSSRGLRPSWRSCSLCPVWSLSTAPSQLGLTALSLAKSWSRLPCRHQDFSSQEERAGIRVAPGWFVSFPCLQGFLKSSYSALVGTAISTLSNFRIEQCSLEDIFPFPGLSVIMLAVGCGDGGMLGTRAAGL